MRYFSHDTNAMGDELMIQLRLEHGLEAVACYWAILEYIYSEEKPLAFGENQRETKSVLYRLGLGFEVLEKYVETMIEVGLLVWAKSQGSRTRSLTSLRAEEAIETYNVRAEAARQNGKKGGRPKNQSGNPEKTQSVSSSVSKIKPNEKLYKTKSRNTYSGISTTDKSSSFKETAVLSEFAQKAIAETEASRQAQEALEAQATPCPFDIKAIFEEAEKC